MGVALEDKQLFAIGRINEKVVKQTSPSSLLAFQRIHISPVLFMGKYLEASMSRNLGRVHIFKEFSIQETPTDRFELRMLLVLSQGALQTAGVLRRVSPLHILITSVHT